MSAGNNELRQRCSIFAAANSKIQKKYVRLIFRDLSRCGRVGGLSQDAEPSARDAEPPPRSHTPVLLPTPTFSVSRLAATPGHRLLEVYPLPHCLLTRSPNRTKLVAFGSFARAQGKCAVPARVTVRDGHDSFPIDTVIKYDVNCDGMAAILAPYMCEVEATEHDRRRRLARFRCSFESTIAANRLRALQSILYGKPYSKQVARDSDSLVSWSSSDDFKIVKRIFSVDNKPVADSTEG
jgi:hypothetical protein